MHLRRVVLVSSFALGLVLSCGHSSHPDNPNKVGIRTVDRGEKVSGDVTRSAAPEVRPAPALPRSTLRASLQGIEAALLLAEPWLKAASTTTTTRPQQHVGGTGLVSNPNPPQYPASYQPCGGTDYPPCYRVQSESRGDYNAYNPTGCGGRGCYGKWQFSGEWACKLGLPCDLRFATPAEQDNAARLLWNHGTGCSNWSAC